MEKLLTKSEVAKLLRCSTRSVDRWKEKDKSFPQPVRKSPQLLWRESDIGKLTADCMEAFDYIEKYSVFAEFGLSHKDSDQRTPVMVRKDSVVCFKEDEQQTASGKTTLILRGVGPEELLLLSVQEDMIEVARKLEPQIGETAEGLV